jgi:hypothetical protein
MAWQKASGYNLRAKVEASIGRYKRVIGGAGSRTDQTEATEIAIAAAALNRMMGRGRPNYFRISCAYALGNVFAVLASRPGAAGQQVRRQVAPPSPLGPMSEAIR